MTEGGQCRAIAGRRPPCNWLAVRIGGALGGHAMQHGKSVV